MRRANRPLPAAASLPRRGSTFPASACVLRLTAPQSRWYRSYRREVACQMATPPLRLFSLALSPLDIALCRGDHGRSVFFCQDNAEAWTWHGTTTGTGTFP